MVQNVKVLPPSPVTLGVAWSSFHLAVHFPLSLGNMEGFLSPQILLFLRGKRLMVHLWLNGSYVLLHGLLKSWCLERPP